MKALLLAALLLWAATMVFPDLASGAQVRAATLWGWTADLLERPAAPVTNRYRRVQAETHLNKTSRHLVLQRNQGQRPPEAHELAAFLARHEITPDGLDPWGTPYHIVHEPDSVAIMSAGPDRRFETDDDLVVRLRFPRRDPVHFRH
jgi:hypothetical protein